MSLFSKWFGRKEEKTERQLTHPGQLQIGDIIALDDSFALPPQLRGQSLEVKQVNTYEFEHRRKPEWVLQGDSDALIFLGIEQDDEARLAFSVKITRDQVAQLFDLDNFAQLFEEPGDCILKGTGQLPVFNGWYSDIYRQVDFATMGYFHQRDFRKIAPSRFEGEDQGDSFELYSLESDDKGHSIDVEVYEGGETDVTLCLYRPLSDIRSYWPK